MCLYVIYKTTLPVEAEPVPLAISCTETLGLVASAVVELCDVIVSGGLSDVVSDPDVVSIATAGSEDVCGGCSGAGAGAEGTPLPLPLARPRPRPRPRAISGCGRTSKPRFSFVRETFLFSFLCVVFLQAHFPRKLGQNFSQPLLNLAELAA